MSVNNYISSQRLKQIITQTQEGLIEDLRKCHTYLIESHNQIQNTINMHLSQFIKQQDVYKANIQQLEYQIVQLKEDNSFLRNQYMEHSIKQEELKKSRLRILQENAEKEERVRVLAEEVERIKSCMSNLNNLEVDKNIVNFDEEQDCLEIVEKLEGLETIKEVSEHDFSMTMSVQSLNSDILEESQHLPETLLPLNEGSFKELKDSQSSLGAENYQIQNYQDALKFLKSYNTSGRGMKMTKKPIVEVEKSGSDGLLHKDTNLPTEKKGNDTINKIKRMRKIDDSGIEALPMSKSNQQNQCLHGNEVSYLEQYGSIVQSKIQYVDEPHDSTVEDKSKSTVSINSNKFKSRIRENIMSLQDPIKSVIQLLQHINAANLHALKRQKVKDNFSRITYVGGLEYLGHCNQCEEPSGFGKLLLNKEVIYQGEWRCGKFHGWGKLVLLSFAKDKEKSIIEIDGHFKCGMMQGSVVCTFSTGERFMGLIKNQSIQKQGTFVGERGIMTGFWQGNKLIYLI